tara:strand:+ start:11118 stop:11579 length:462 start_codon:yes stop_codon:yes gene_type:complete
MNKFEQWYKLYIVKLKNTKYIKPHDAREMYKIGITHHMDVKKRFDPKVDDGYPKIYDDWVITPCYSQVYKTKQEAEAVEAHILHQRFPPSTHKVWIEQYLGCADQNEYYTNTGITEIRLLTKSELKCIIDELQRTQSVHQVNKKQEIRQRIYG